MIYKMIEMFIVTVLVYIAFKWGVKIGKEGERSIWKDRLEALKKMYDTTIDDLTTGEKEN